MIVYSSGSWRVFASFFACFVAKDLLRADYLKNVCRNCTLDFHEYICALLFATGL